MSDERDRIYAEPRDTVPDFAFDAAVTAVFPDMIRRSVPGYGTVIAMLGLFAEHQLSAGGRVYDLGCSLGAATLAMRRRMNAPGCRMIAVDSSPEMVEACRRNVAADASLPTVDVLCADIRDVAIENASLVILNFTLQFIPPEERLSLLQRIARGLRPGGVLVVSEKIAFADPAEAGFHQDMHLAFKRANGYSELEISQKRSALERVLIPDSLETHRTRLSAAGFDRCEIWFQCFNFVSLAARIDGDRGQAEEIAGRKG